jgi:cytochrome P450
MHNPLALTNVVDVLLRPEYKATAATAAHSHDPRQLKALISEAIRISVPLGGVYREVITDVTLSTGTTYNRGDWVFVSLKDANRDVSLACALAALKILLTAWLA